MPRPTRQNRAPVSQETTGMLPLPSTEVQNPEKAPSPTVKQVTAASVKTATRAPKQAHQTHGAVTPITGPITNISQLTNRGQNVAKGAAGSFQTMAEYTAYLKTLSLHDLHRHAVESARIVPIDDRERLIRRLETAWTGNVNRYPGSAAGGAIPKRPGFTQEQVAKQQELRDKLLRR